MSGTPPLHHFLMQALQSNATGIAKQCNRHCKAMQQALQSNAT
jgi:hypothetical protein